LAGGIEREGVFPEVNRKMIYPSERRITRMMSKYGEAIEALAFAAQSMLLYSFAKRDE
jgi:hypothetical protein